MGSPSYQTSGMWDPPVSLLICEYSWISAVVPFSFPALLLYLQCLGIVLEVCCVYCCVFWWCFGSSRLSRNLLWQWEYLQELRRTLGLPRGSASQMTVPNFPALRWDILVWWAENHSALGCPLSSAWALSSHADLGSKDSQKCDF